LDSRRIRNLAVSASVAIIVALVFLSGAMEGMEQLTLDYRLRTFAQGTPPPVTFVAIDSNTIKKLGKWPIPREHYARVLGRVQEDGSGAVLMDIDFSSEGPDPEWDKALTQAVRRGKNIVLAVQMEERVVLDGALVRSLSLPIPGLMEATPLLGSITFEVDPDGVVRKMPEPIDIIDEIYQPLGIVGARIIDPEVSLDFPDGALISMSYRNLESLTVVPFSSVLEGEFKPGVFLDRIVLVGATTPELHDFWMTPIGVIPGIYIQAAVIETALNRSWFTRSGKVSTVAAIVIISLILGQLFGRTRRLKGLFYLGGYLVLLTVAVVIFASVNKLINVIPLFSLALLQYPIHLALHARGTERILELTREKTDALLKFSELKAVEDAGRDDYLVPLVLLRQVLNLERIYLFRSDSTANPPWKVETVLGEEPAEESADAAIVREVMERGEIVSVHKDSSGTGCVYVPMMTSRSKYGVLFVEGSWRILKDHENARILFSYATQASYYLETWELDQRVKSLYTNTIKAITRALDSRDYYTSAHSELSLEYVEKFGRACGLDRVQIEALHIGTLLHDIGKIGIPDDVLNKNDKLTKEEFEIIKQHPVIGYEIIKDLPFPPDVKMIVQYHHERFDGSGYPDGLKGDQIPLLVRIFSILDTYEALIGVRPYKDPMLAEGAKSVLRESAGSQFDPELLSTFLSVF
jgi:putative nucleotidyltransferase with HDIG domain